MTWVAGFDPGASAALVVLRCDGRSKPEWVGGWNIWGTPPLRWARLVSAFGEIGQPVGLSTPQLAIETPAGGGASSRRNGWQVSVGRSIGQAEALAKLAGWRVEIVPANVWPGRAGVRCGKQGEGLHRISEAKACIEGYPALALPETKAGRERQVCLAEAALIARSQIN